MLSSYNIGNFGECGCEFQSFLNVGLDRREAIGIRKKKKQNTTSEILKFCGQPALSSTGFMYFILSTRIRDL